MQVLNEIKTESLEQRLTICVQCTQDFGDNHLVDICDQCEGYFDNYEKIMCIETDITGRKHTHLTCYDGWKRDNKIEGKGVGADFPTKMKEYAKASNELGLPKKTVNKI